MTLNYDLDCWNVDEMICPHCHEKQEDAWEYHRDWGNVNCQSCQKPFHYTREIRHLYTTTKLDAAQDTGPALDDPAIDLDEDNP